MAINHSQASGTIRIGMCFLLPIWQWLRVCSSHVFFSDSLTLLPLGLTGTQNHHPWHGKISKWPYLSSVHLCIDLENPFSKACFPHMKQEAALDQTSPIHNNSTLCRVKGGDFEIVHKNLQVLGNLAKSIFNKAVSYQMDISLILPGLSSVFNN